ncbi:hypothetical protein ABMA27_004672 [Loxostege sticticalis]|uniref:Microsomal triglyceride transfer protein large subunit n=1 Tax=Loxostege sticticalis TaxID=481309 RepID=A0ABR3HK80_LOXSC
MRPLVFILVSVQCVSLVQWAVSSSVPRHEYSEVKLFQTPGAYDVESTVLLNDVAKTDKEVGYKIKAQLHVHPLWADSYSEFFLKFNLKSPQLHLRGSHINADFRAFSSVWDSYKDSSFYVHWKSGVIQAAYLDPAELPDVLNYKKGLISLFQFQIIDGQYNETDISGVCDVLYESISSTVFRKIKRNCVPVGDESEQDKKSSESVALRRITRYTLGPAAQALEAIYADELLEVGDRELGVKARSWHSLKLAGPATAAPAVASLDAALQALPKGLAPAVLQLAAGDATDENLDLEAALAASKEALESEQAGSGGRVADAAAALRLLPALRAANVATLRALLQRDSSYPMLSGLCRMLGLAGTRAAFAAADSFLHLGARDPLLPLARDYLAALALAPRPRGGRAPALAALDALAAAPPHALHVARRRRLEAVALLPGRPLEVRAAALDLYLRRSASKPLPLITTALELHRHGPGELRRVLWQRLRALEPEHAKLRELLPLFPRELATWHAQAHAGTSSVLTRPTGWRAGAFAAELESLQAAASGLLRRGTVRLLAKDKENSTLDMLTVEVWTRGLEAVAGGGAADAALYEGEDAAAADAAGGLGLAVAGARLPPIDLFKGQGELLGHVWAGTGSSPTPVLRAIRPLPPLDTRVPLSAGVVVHATRQVAFSVALDAHATVSLWSRSARSGLEFRAGAAGEALLSLQTAWGRAAARSTAGAEPALRIAADLDFYDAIALCVRVRLDEYERKKESYLESVQGSRNLKVSRWRNETLPLAGRTLSLGRVGDAACRTLTAGDD